VSFIDEWAVFQGRPFVSQRIHVAIREVLMAVQTQKQVKAMTLANKPRGLGTSAILRQLQAFSFTVPALVLLAIFLIYPIGYVIYLSFQRWNLLGNPAYIGIKNYNTLFLHSADFFQAIGSTLLFVVLAVPTQIILGLYLAVLLNEKFAGRTFFRTTFFIPMAISFVAAGIVFERIFSTGSNLGIIPQTLANIGINFPDWEHRSGTWAMLIIVLMNTWKSAGYSMIVYLAGLQSINPDYYEAAQIDGAQNAWQRFLYISLPLLGPTTTLLLITHTIGSFRAFVPFFVMTNGGPAGATTTLIFFVYNNYANRTGVASAATTLFLIAVLAITAVQFLITRRQNVYY